MILKQKKGSKKAMLMDGRNQKRFRMRRMVIYGIEICSLILVFIFSAYYVRSKNDKKYQMAVEYISDEKYEEAIKLLTQIRNYNGAKEKRNEAEKISKQNEAYVKGTEFIKKERYQDAIEEFSKYIDYKDCSEKVKEASYLLGINYYQTEDYIHAKEYFIKADGYKNSEILLSKTELKTLEQSKQTLYNEAKRYYNKEKYNEALELFELLSNYKKSKRYIKKCKIQLKRMEKK